MKTNLAYPLLVFIAGSSYGFIVPVVKASAGQGIFPSAFLPLQYLTAFILCLGFYLAACRKHAKATSLAKMALLGVFTGLTSICYYTAVTLLPSAVALTLLFQYVWISVLIECIVERHPPTRSSVVAIAIVLVGTVFAAGLLDGSFGSLDPVGIAFGAGSALFYALFLYASGRIEPAQPAPLRTLMLTVGGLVVTTLANPQAWVTAATDASLWPYAVGLAFLGIIIPTGLINFASPSLSPGMVSIMASSELPVGIFAAWALIGDTPSPLVLFGAFLVLVGIAVKQLPTLRALKR